VNRLTYGLRDEPYVIVSELGRRLEVTASVLPAVVETLARALKLPYAAIVLADGQTAAVYGHGEGSATFALTYQSEPVGRLLVAPRRSGEPLTPADQRLIADLARQIGPAAHAHALAAALQRSRERLVTAREEERRRLRRDLHDGLGPTLAGLALKASTISDLPPADAARVGDELYSQIRATIADVRRLVYQLRPPSLDELGLAGAVRQTAAAQARPGVLDVVVDAPDLPPLPAAVEVAALRIAGEALTNAARHSGARTVRVSLRCCGNPPDALEVEVVDDGAGIPPGQPAGIGLVAMRERTAELGGTLVIDSTAGGGTTVVARLPLLVGDAVVGDAVVGDAGAGPDRG
jgi:signal transduction histidine kinase